MIIPNSGSCWNVAQNTGCEQGHQYWIDQPIEQCPAYYRKKLIDDCHNCEQDTCDNQKPYHNLTGYCQIAPVYLNTYNQTNYTITHTFPASTTTSQSFNIPAFKLDQYDNTSPVSYSLVRHEPTSQDLTVTIQRDNDIADQLKVTYTTQEEELNSFYSKTFTMLIQGTENGVTKQENITLILCPRESRLKINTLKFTPWVVNNVTYQYDFSQDNSILQETTQQCQLKDFDVFCPDNQNTITGNQCTSDFAFNNNYCSTHHSQSICQTVKVTKQQINVIHTFNIKVVLQSNITQTLGPLEFNVSYCIPSSVKYSTDQFMTQPIEIQKNISDGKVVIPFNAFSYTMKDTFCHDDPKVYFNSYQLQMTNADSFTYPDFSDADCSSCNISQTCNFTDCLQTTAISTFQNKLIQVKVHVVIGPESSKFHLIDNNTAQHYLYQSGIDYTQEYYNQYAPTDTDIQAVIEIMPKGCSDINYANFAQGRFVHLSYFRQNVNVLHIIGIEAECVKSMTISTHQPEMVQPTHAITYCANIQGICQVPLSLTSSDVIFYMGLPQSNGDLDETQGYLKSNSSTLLRQVCVADKGLFTGYNETMFLGKFFLPFYFFLMFLGMPKHHNDSQEGRVEWYNHNYQSLRCYYQLRDRRDPQGNMMYTAVELNASLALTIPIQAQMFHTNGSYIDLGKIDLFLTTQKDPYGVGCGFRHPIIFREENKTVSDHFVFHSRDGNATLGLEQFRELNNTCLYCPIKYQLMVLNDTTNTYEGYMGNLVGLNSTFGLEIYNFKAQNTSSQKVYIEANYDTSISSLHYQKCLGYRNYSKLDVTMCNSSLLIIQNTLRVSVYEPTFDYTDKEQVIDFKDLFLVESLDTNSTEPECENITYTLSRSDWQTYNESKENITDPYILPEKSWDKVFEIDNVDKKLKFDIRLFEDMRDLQTDSIPFTIHGWQNTTQLIEQESNLIILGPIINKSPFFADENGTLASLGLITLEVDLEAMKAGTAPTFFEQELPILMDKEGDIPIVQMQESSGVLELREDSVRQYSITANLTKIEKKNQGQYPVSFTVTDIHFVESRRETKQFASLEIIVHGEDEVEELVQEAIQEEVIEEEVIEQVVIVEVKLPPPPKVEAQTMETAATMRADSLIGASLVVQPKPPPGVSLITEEEQNELVDDWLNNLEVPEVEYEPPPVKIQISKIKRDGNTKLGFNQDMIVPEFIRKIKSKSSRQLSDKGPSSLEEINLSSILSISFGIKSSVEQSDLEYYILLKDWTSRDIDFQIFFDNPTLISKGNLQDTMLLDILQPQLFVSQAKGETLSPDQLSIASGMPTQVPQGIDADALEKNAKQQQGAVIGVVIVQIIGAFTLKGAKQDLIYLILSLQLVIAFRIYDVSMPPNFDEFSLRIQEIVDGKVISPEFLMQLVKPDFSYNSALNLPDGYLDGSILSTWGMIITVVACVLLFLLLQGLAFIILKSRRAQIRERLMQLKKKFIWSGLIEAHTIEYILMLTTIVNNCKSLILGQKTRRIQKIYEVSIIAPELIIFPLLILLLTCWKSKKIEMQDEEITQKYHYLVANVTVHKNWYSKYYVFAMLIRRLLLAILPIVFFQRFVFQIQCQMLISLAYIIFYSGVRPTVIRQHQYLMETNEVFIMVTSYHMLLFTDFVDAKKHYSVSVSLVNIILLLIMINFMVMGYNMICRLHIVFLNYGHKRLNKEYQKRRIARQIQIREERFKRELKKKLRKEWQRREALKKVDQSNLDGSIPTQESNEKPNLGQKRQSKQDKKERQGDKNDSKVDKKKSLKDIQRRWNGKRAQNRNKLELEIIKEVDAEATMMSQATDRSEESPEKKVVMNNISVKTKRIIATQLIESQLKDSHQDPVQQMPDEESKEDEKKTESPVKSPKKGKKKGKKGKKKRGKQSQQSEEQEGPVTAREKTHSKVGVIGNEKVNQVFLDEDDPNGPGETYSRQVAVKSKQKGLTQKRIYKLPKDDGDSDNQEY